MARRCTLFEKAGLGNVKGHVRTLREQVGPARAGDPDGIHDLRVVSRRLRASLAEHGPLFGKEERKRLRKRMRKVTQTFGKPRELDVTLATLESRRRKFRGPPRYALGHKSESERSGV